MADIQRVFAELGLTLLERGWLSSNSIVFAPCGSVPSAIVDTGYVSQAEQIVELVERVLNKERPGRIVNTHLHSDHCGGNSLLSRHFPTEILVPEASLELVRRWDQDALSYVETGQRCERFAVHGALSDGSTIRLGTMAWNIVAAPGHDPDAVMLFEPKSRVLITADALWEDRLAIIFPEIDGSPGFGEAAAVLATIEALQPSIVIPGHGRAFCDVNRALERSRMRISHFEQEPERHIRYAVRSLTIFHMLEVRQTCRDELTKWLCQTPIFAKLHSRSGCHEMNLTEFAASVVDQLLADGLVRPTTNDQIAIR